MMAQIAYASSSQIVQVDVMGMTCPFCVYGVQKSLSSMPGVLTVAVSLKYRKARITMRHGHAINPSLVREKIIDAGYTPGRIQILME